MDGNNTITQGWRVGDAGHTVFGPKREDGSAPEIIATVKKPANAALIVRAVNAHAGLVAACKALLAQEESDGGDKTAAYYLAEAALAKAGA